MISLYDSACQVPLAARICPSAVTASQRLANGCLMARWPCLRPVVDRVPAQREIECLISRQVDDCLARRRRAGRSMPSPVLRTDMKRQVYNALFGCVSPAEEVNANVRTTSIQCRKRAQLVGCRSMFFWLRG
jgi:hypothetical protein